MVGMDGNAFSIIARVERAMKRAKLVEEAKAFRIEAMGQPSYDALLALVMRTVEID
jgi:hypothetical protein